MLAIIGLVIAATGIASLARGRGAQPFVAGGLAVTGYIAIVYVAPFFLPTAFRTEDAPWILLLCGWIWVALVAGYVRFVIGFSKPKPDGYWKCSNCSFLNNPSSIICEACQQPWKSEHSEATAG